MITTPEVLVRPDGRMDRKNAATYVGLAEKTLAQYASHGTGPRFIKQGRCWYFKADLDKWLASGHEHKPAAAAVAA